MVIFKELLDQGGKPDLLDAQQLGRDHGVEHLTARPEVLPGAHQAQVVVGAVQDQPLVPQDLDQTRHLQLGERVHDEVPASDRELDQADLLEVVVQAVRLGIQRHRFMLPDALVQPFQGSGVADVDIVRRFWRAQ